MRAIVCSAPAIPFRRVARRDPSPWRRGNWRYIGPATVDAIPNTPAGAGCADCHIQAFNYFDLAAQYRFRDRYTLRAGVNNIFDRDPPIIGQGQLPPTIGSGNTYPQVYDPLGRFLFVGLTADF
ncbi:MAG: hypothetical protein ACR2FH_00145 [Caulobacteraceae bacterium]